MLEESEARKRILDAVESGPIIWVPLELALGQALAQDLRALVDSPPYDAAEIDGYAVRAAEAGAGAALRVPGDPPCAGAKAGRPLGEGEARRILAGAPLPRGADAVVPLEKGEIDADGLRSAEAIAPGDHVRPRGGDVEAGRRILRRAEAVGPARIGLLASQGIPEVPVFARPLVQVVSAGADLVEPGSPLHAGERYDGSRPMLHAAVERAGGVVATACAGDSRSALIDCLASALAVADCVVVCGASADGGPCRTREALASLGTRAEFLRPRLEPEMPLLFGRHPSGPVVFGLPEDPGAALTAFTLFVAPAIRKQMGFPAEDGGLRRIASVAGEALSNPGDRPRYLPASHRDGAVGLAGGQSPYAIGGLARANCLVRLDGGESVPRGAPVSAVCLW